MANDTTIPQATEREESSAEKRLETLLYLRDMTRKMLHETDARMRLWRIISLGMQMTQLICLSSIPFLIYFLSDLQFVRATVSVFAILGLFGGAYQIAFNPQGRWIQFMQLRLEAQKRLLDIDLYVHSKSSLSEREYADIFEGLTKVLHQQQSLWSVDDFQRTDVEDARSVRR